MGPHERKIFRLMGTPRFADIRDPRKRKGPQRATGEVMRGPSDDGAGSRREDRMAYRELTMIDVREVLRRWQSRQSIKSMARGTRIDRKTVRRYIEMAEQIGIDKRAVLTDAVVHEIAQSVQSRLLPEPSEAWRAVEPHRAQIEKWIAEDLRLSRMYALLVRSGVSDVTYATLRRYAMQELGWRKKQATVRLHGTTRKVPRDEYLLVEKSAMLAAPTTPFDVPSFVEAKVHPDHHIQVARALYSVPTMYLGKRVRVRIDSKTVPFEELLTLVLTDEIARRDTTAVDNRVAAAKLDPDMCIERFDKSAKITFDRKLFNELCSLRFLQAHRHVVILGPVGVGKTFIANTLGHLACRHRYDVRFLRADVMLSILKKADSITHTMPRWPHSARSTCSSSTTSRSSR